MAGFLVARFSILILKFYSFNTFLLLEIVYTCICNVFHYQFLMFETIKCSVSSFLSLNRSQLMLVTLKNVDVNLPEDVDIVRNATSEK